MIFRPIVANVISMCQRCPARSVLFAVVLASVTPHDARPQDRDDLTALSLEELLDTDLVPLNVAGVHTHFAGEWMVRVRYMLMDMAGNRDGTAAVDENGVLQNFMVAPTRMRMHMEMLEVMYAPSDELTLMLMVPLRQTSMDHVTRTGTRFTTSTGGVGDVIAMAHVTLLGNILRTHHRLILNARVDLPTGSVTERGDIPAGADQKLPYPMQLGHGSITFRPGLAYLGDAGTFAWALMGDVDLHAGRNSEGYSLGDSRTAELWGSWAATDWLAPFATVTGRQWNDIDGADSELNPMMVPTANPDLRGGRRLDLGLGIQAFASRGLLDDHRVAVQLSKPLYQSLNGPQLETDWVLQLTWAVTF